MTPNTLLERATATAGSSLALPPALLVLAHPDDEVIAVGARLSRFGDAHFLQVTDGAPRNEQDSRAHGFSTLAAYRKAREKESQQAFHLAGIGHAHCDSLGFPDQEASLHLLDLTQTIHQRLRSLAPQVVFTHPYEGGHPDHDSCAFAVHTAVRLLAADAVPQPLIIESAFYHAGPQGMQTGSFLDNSAGSDTLEYALSPAESKNKRTLLACFTSQQQTLQSFPLDRELFRIAPAYDFTQPPHPGACFYDNYDWGMRTLRFCKLARKAEAALLPEPLRA